MIRPTKLPPPTLSQLQWLFELTRHHRDIVGSNLNNLKEILVAKKKSGIILTPEEKENELAHAMEVSISEDWMRRIQRMAKDEDIRMKRVSKN